MNTEEIIKGCLENDRKSQRILYESCFNVMMKVSRRYHQSEDDIMECMNTTFLKVLKNLNKLNDPNLIFGWVKQIAINTAIDITRQRMKHYDKNKYTLDNDYSAAKNTYQINDFTENSIDNKEIFKMIQSLPDLTRQVLNLFAIDGFSHKEISNTLGLSEEASRWHLHKARKLMTEKLELLNFVEKKIK